MLARAFKYGLLIAAVCGLQSVEAQNRRFGGGAGFGFAGGSLESSAVQIALLDPVKTEVKLDDEQARKLQQLADELRESTQGLFSREDFAGLSGEERTRKMREVGEKRRSLADANAKKAQEVLKPEQWTRLKEIAFQQRLQGGIAAAFRVDEFVEAAKVTDDQKEKVEELTQALRREAEQQSDNRGEQFTWISREGNQKYAPKFEALLTDEQKTVLANMKGKEFDVAQLRPQRGGARQGGQRARPGGQGTRPGGQGGRPQRPQRPGQDNS
jgi:predicted transcriptional regulator